MSANQGRSFVWLGVTFAVIVLIAVAPVISVLMSTAIAAALGCQVDEGSAHLCPFMGIDLGEFLVLMFVLGWLAIVTLPFGAVALVVWLIVACVVTLIRWRRRQREVKRPSPLLKQERT